MQKDFDTWNILKKNLENKQHLFCQPRDIWWCSLGINVGSEEDGKNELFERPVLVIKVFNTGMARVVPLTTRLREDANHVLIRYENRIGAAKISQLKTISTKRLSRKLLRLEDSEFKKVIQALAKSII